MLREIKHDQRKSRVLALRVTGTGTAVIDEGSTAATLVDNGTGDWTLTFVVPFSRIPSVKCQTLTAASHLQISTVTVSAVRVLGFAMDGTTAKDAVFHLQIHGWDTADVT